MLLYLVVLVLSLKNSSEDESYFATTTKLKLAGYVHVICLIVFRFYKVCRVQFTHLSKSYDAYTVSAN